MVDLLCNISLWIPHYFGLTSTYLFLAFGGSFGGSFGLSTTSLFLSEIFEGVLFSVSTVFLFDCLCFIIFIFSTLNAWFWDLYDFYERIYLTLKETFQQDLSDQMVPGLYYSQLEYLFEKSFLLLFLCYQMALYFFIRDWSARVMFRI